MVTGKPSEHVLRLSETIYARDCIEQAMTDFAHLAEISRTEQGVSFRSKGAEPADRIAYEFGNYVLGLMRNR
jgi:hypothetical protein